MKHLTRCLKITAISLLLITVIFSCKKEDYIEVQQPDASEQFFAYDGQVKLTKSVINFLKIKNDSCEFIPALTEKYGYPLWNETIDIYEADMAVLFVPIHKKELDEIETIWVFRITGGRIYYHPVQREEADENERWTFDYFTQDALNKKPQSEIWVKPIIEKTTSTRGQIVIEYCNEIWTGSSSTGMSYQYTHCWIKVHNFNSGWAMADFPDGPGGNWGGTSDGGGGGYLPPPVSASTELQKIMKSISMTDAQKEKLNQALDDFIKEGCMQKALYDALFNKNVKLDFGMVATPTDTSAPANYNPNNKSIKFKNASEITNANLKEELFHAWQDAYYPGGTAQYGKDAYGNKLPGYVNIEFEAKVFKDTIMEFGSYSAFFRQETDEEQEIYKEYVNGLKA